jgi:ABC-type transport system involved in multi-copper enzyme maturation permease subunit
VLALTRLLRARHDGSHASPPEKPDVDAMSWRKLWIVARFELAEALRSRLVIVILGLYGMGAALGAFLFTKALAAAEDMARSALSNMNAHQIPDDLVRREAVPRVISGLVSDPELRQELSRIDPLALFYGFMALQLVALLVLVTSGGAHATDLSRGATRFVLTRCDRWSWAIGKLLGHAGLLAVGLALGALVTSLVAFGQERGDAANVLWLLRAAFRAWVYGLAYLGIYSAIALVVRVPGRARALSIVALIAMWMVYSSTQSGWLGARVPAAEHLGWLFPAHYKLLLWSPNWLESMPAVLALLAIGGAAFSLGSWLFGRGDA